MVPTPQEQGQQSLRPEKKLQGLNGEQIVISGMSGLFPQSRSVTEFSKKLYNKVNPVTSEYSRWEWKHPEASEYVGKVPDLDRFDSQFFMVHSHLSHRMDPMSRKALEQSYQAIYDAGLSPKHLNGKKVGVFIAASISESEKAGIWENKSKSGFGITGCSKTMFANRISYWLNFKGPSMTLDDAGCGSMVALEEACNAINSGICEAAIVGGTNLRLLPQAQVHYNRCIKISPDEKTRSFAENANGCTLSEAISVLFLQKAKNALRVYAEVVHVENKFISKLSGETGQVFGFIRDPDSTVQFLKQFYSDASIPPQAVEYIEAFGSATPEADKTELQAIEKVFCESRTDPLLVGSVISNIGFTEAAAGVAAISKVLLGYHHGMIASNLHCETPRQDIPAIRDGRMCIVTEHQPFRGSYAAVNCLSITGVNSHVLLRGCPKPKDSTRYKASIPRLVVLSARLEEHLQKIFQDLISRPIDPEELALLQNIHSTNISGHLGRGYIILDTDDGQNTISLSEKSKHSDEMQRPLWFVYSGMGSQWAGMGAQLMRIPIFAAAIQRCHKILRPKGIDIMDIITSPDKTIFDNILYSFLGIAAIQIGLTDILKALGLHPDKIIGHSVGEVGCAYADGCMTAEEVILSAYSRGKVSNDTIFIRGAMAAVGLGYHQVSKMCPPTIDIACHNGPESCTISGPEEDIREFVTALTASGVFAKEVPSSNIAFHSRYITDGGPDLLRLLSGVIREPRVRSERWLSTSVPQDRWDEPIAKYCSPEYLTNNLLSPVYFEETSKLVPSNAVLIEIAPHGLLQAILKRSLPQSCMNISLAQRGHKDNALLLLNAIGNLYVEGFSPQVQEIYPKVEFPVSTGTPHLAHLPEWNHTASWYVADKNLSCVRSASTCNFLITTHDDEHSYLKGNVIQGKVFYPFAAALVAVWDTLAMTLGASKNSISVKFNDIVLYSQPILHDQKLLKLNVSVHRVSGRFQVLNGDYKVAKGYIAVIQNSSRPETETISNNFNIRSEDLYEQFSSRGYFYSDEFQSLHSANEFLTTAQLIWNDNWVTMLDGVLQLNALRQTYVGVSQPNQITLLTINVLEHLHEIQKSPSDGKTLLKVEFDEDFDCTRCGGVVLQYIKYRNVPPPVEIQEIFKLVSPNRLGNDVSDDKNKISWDNVEGQNLSLQIATLGNVDTFHWVEAPKHQKDEGVNVTVEYAGINISDVKRATKIIPFEDNEKYYGMDFSGLTERGERVMGLVRNGAASTMVVARPELLWPVPAYWSLEEAATVPLAYVQAYYCLCVKNELQKGWRVLIHGAAGALGQAAIAVALAHGCRVFATVADRAKKRFLLKLFPELDEDAIGNSRDGSFVDMVLNATNGEGCQIVISCLREDLKNCSLKCAAFSGVTVDTVQIQNRDIFEYGMFNMTKQRSYIAADFYSIFDSDNTTKLKKLQRLLSDGIARGHVRPLSRVTFAPHEAPRAFRLLAASRHRGRVLLRMRDAPPAALPRIICAPHGTHLIVWDGSSFGLQLADRLIARGATKLRIYCLSPKSHYLLKLRMWKKLGVDVEIFSVKLSDSDTIASILYETNLCGPIDGIYVIATDSLIICEQQNYLSSVIDHLDTTSRIVCLQLKYFAVITVSSNIGQNTIISRSKNGFPATLLTLPTLTITHGNTTNREALTKESRNLSAVNVTEQALRRKNPVLVAQPQAVEKPSLSKLLHFTDNDDEDTTLQESGKDISLPLIKSFLRDVHHVSLEDEDILMLTKKKILEIEMSSSELSFEDVKGLGTFISYIDPDELRATSEMVPLNTLVSQITTMEDGIDETKTHLFIIPGLEGHHERFRKLCERLKLPALVLQPGLDRPTETVQELAKRYAKVLIEIFKLKTTFCLLGYECGIFTALELASILEDHGLTGTVFCIGDGPKELQAVLEKEVLAFGSEEALQEGVARHMFALMTRGSAAPAESALRGCSSWRARVDACVRTLLGRVSHSAQYARALLEAAYARIGTARRYSAEPRALRSRLVLLRARPRREPDSGDECSLQRYSQRALIVRDLAAPMAHAAADLRAPAIINRYLGDDLLEIYKNTNLCEAYLFEILN